MLRLRGSPTRVARRRLGVTYQPPHIARLQVEHALTPEGAIAVEPRTANDVAAVLKHASERRLNVQVVGGGEHSGFGNPDTPQIVMSMAGLAEVETWEPDDLTIVAGAGAPIAEIEERLSQANQTLVMPEHPGKATLGGVVAAGISSLRRGRLYSTRERILETTMVTGDGRIVRSGGRVVKNVSGYDVHRLAVGAFGSLGVIVSLCIKLWPQPPGAMTVTLDDPDEASTIARPLAVLESDGVTQVFLSGTEAEVETQAKRLRGDVEAGHEWPSDPRDEYTWSLRVPPALTSDAVSRLPDDWTYLAVIDVGEIRCGSSGPDSDLRSWAESVGGALVMTSGDPTAMDPWGKPPPGIELQRKLIQQFDPARVINPGRLPGGL